MKGPSKLFPLVGAALVALAMLASAAAPPAARPKEALLALPVVLGKSAPANPQELKEIQDHLQKVLKKVMPAVVGIRVGMSAGSGVIIDEEGHVLTAGHVSGKPGRKERVRVILPNGKSLEAETLGQNTLIDSGLIKITAKGKWPHVEMGDSSKVTPGQWVVSIGHPGGFKPTRTPVVRLGRVSIANRNIIRTDCTLVGGDSGGPLFDMQGRVIGIHSRIGARITDNIHVPVNTYRDTWTRLVARERWGPRAQSQAFIGIGFVPGGNDLKVTNVVEDSPAERGGVKVGDVVTQIDDKKLDKREALFEYLQEKDPGDQVRLRLKRDDETVRVRIRLAARPGG